MILMAVIAFATIDLSLLAFCKTSQAIRKKNSKSIVLNPGIKTKMLNTISEMNKRLKDYESSTVKKEQYIELAKKYNLLLNSYRELSNKNNSLKSRIEKLKQKIY
jgi:hypothetical protein